MKGDLTAKHLQSLRAAIRLDSPEMHRALTRVGMLLRNAIVINITKMGLVNTGNLRKSIRYELYSLRSEAGVSVGSFGVPYARILEYGFTGSQSVKGHDRRNAKSGKSFPVRGHSRRVSRAGKQFMSNAVKPKVPRVYEILRSELRGK